MFGSLNASTIAILWWVATVVGRLYAEWNLAGLSPVGSAGFTSMSPWASTFTHDMHAAYFGSVDTEHTRFACATGLEADAETAGKAPSTANTPTHTINRRVMTQSLPRRTRRPPNGPPLSLGSSARAAEAYRVFGPDLVPRTGEDEGRGPKPPP